MRAIFNDLKDKESDDADFRSAKKFVTRCLEKFDNKDFEIEGNNSTKNYRRMVAGPPTKAVELRQSMFDYFIDVRCSLKGRLPRELFGTYCQLKRDAGETLDEI